MEIESFEWDQANIDHVGRRGITEEQVEAVVDGRYLMVVNKRSGSGDYRLIGRDPSGRFLTVVIAATSSPSRWRPVTAWYSDDNEQARAKRAGA